MTVQARSGADTYVRREGDGASTVFTFTFKVLRAEDIKIDVTASGGSPVRQTLLTNYAVSSIGEEVTTVTFVTAPPALSLVEGWLAMAAEQPEDLTNTDKAPLEVVNLVFDRAVLFIQYMLERLERAVLLPRGSGLRNISWPTPTAGKYLAWNDTATGFKNADGGDGGGGGVVTVSNINILDEGNQIVADVTTINITAGLNSSATGPHAVEVKANPLVSEDAAGVSKVGRTEFVRFMGSTVTQDPLQSRRAIVTPLPPVVQLGGEAGSPRPPVVELDEAQFEVTDTLVGGALTKRRLSIPGGVGQVNPIVRQGGTADAERPGIVNFAAPLLVSGSASEKTIALNETAAIFAACRLVRNASQALNSAYVQWDSPAELAIGGFASTLVDNKELRIPASLDGERGTVVANVQNIGGNSSDLVIRRDRGGTEIDIAKRTFAAGESGQVIAQLTYLQSGDKLKLRSNGNSDFNALSLSIVVDTRGAGIATAVLPVGYTLFDDTGDVVGGAWVDGVIWYRWDGTAYRGIRDKWPDYDAATITAKTLSKQDLRAYQGLHFFGSAQQTLTIPPLVTGYALGGAPPVYEYASLELLVANTAGLRIVAQASGGGAGRITVPGTGIRNRAEVTIKTDPVPATFDKTKVTTIAGRIRLTHDTNPLIYLDMPDFPGLTSAA